MNINSNIRKWLAAGAVLAAFAGCNGELNESAANVELVASNTQDIQQVDIDPTTADPECDDPVGTIEMRVIPKNSSIGEFSDVRVTRYRVSYARTDGGRQVPSSFVRSIDTLLTAGGGAQSLTNFVILQGDAIVQAPFAALQPQNGGRDPDTNRSIVQMDVIVELFGQTLAGDNVYANTRFPLDFCYGCGCE